MENVKKDTEKSPNLFQRIHGVMRDVKSIQKEDKKVNGQYKFVSHDEVSRIMHEAFVNHGIVMMPSVENISQDGNRTEVMMAIHFVNIDDPDDRARVCYPGYGIDQQDKGIGKAISYAVKYALLKVFCLETSDDVEKHNIDHQTNINIHEKKQLESLLNSIDIIVKNSYLEKMMNHWKVKSIDDLTSDQAKEMYDVIRADLNVSYGKVSIPA